MKTLTDGAHSSCEVILTSPLIALIRSGSPERRSPRTEICTTKLVSVALILAVAVAGGSASENLDGRIAYDRCYWENSDYGWCDVVVFDVGGSSRSVGSGVDPALSPDGTRVAFVGNAPSGSFTPPPPPDGDIIVVDLRDGTETNLTSDDPAPASAPAWSRDGRRVAFGSSKSGTFELYAMNADGTGLEQITNGAGFSGYPTWAPDGRIAFECNVAGNQDLCSINSNGTGFVRLTHYEGRDAQPAFSPDGTRIAFVTTRFGSIDTLAILNADGTVTSLGITRANSPAWSPDGSRLSFSINVHPLYCNGDTSRCDWDELYRVNLDGTGVTLLAYGANPTWALSPGGFPPSAVFTVACTLLTCTFDASPSSDDGRIESYAWRFGDLATGTGPGPVHAYATHGSYEVELTVVDDSGMRGTFTGVVTVTDSPPVGSFTVQCDGQTCTFDASSSRDADGVIAAYAWSFGDGMSGSGVVVSHFYAPGTYTVTLTVVDDARATGTSAATATVERPTVHIGDLDGARYILKRTWNASVTLTVHDAAHRPVANATVEGSWSNGGSSSCATDANGVCNVATYGIPNSMGSTTFAVSSVIAGIALYDAAGNHDVDGGTNGTSVTVRRR
jgi:PKD repeat protein